MSRDDRIFMRGKLQGTRENMDMVAMVLMDKCGWHVQEETADSRDTQSIAYLYECLEKLAEEINEGRIKRKHIKDVLKDECGGNKPAVVAPAVALDMTHACDVIRECGEQVPALQARMGTGGNQVPLTYGIGNGQANEAGIMAEEVSQTLNTMHDAQAVMCEDVSHALRAKANCAYRADAETYICSAVDCRNGQESDVGGALQARTGHTLNANGVVRSNMVVRRLTPLECTRLQGYPDGWVDIGDWTDEKGKKHKDADSPKYKALGNSIALPFWDWMLRRMARYLPEGATLGSLFDGIGGFPLCFERIHGRGTARWASEIEPFPIAVTKKWFGEE